MISLSLDLDFINYGETSSILDITPIDPAYITDVLNELWKNVKVYVFDPIVAGHHMFYKVLNRLMDVNEQSTRPRSFDELRLITQHIMNSYDDDKTLELLSLILK